MLILVVPFQGVAAVSAGICMALGYHERLPRMSMVRRAGTNTIMTPPAVTAIMMMAAVEANAAREDGGIVMESEVGQWIAWARHKADWIDPILNAECPVLDEDECPALDEE